jgi:hypothetical protein
MKASTLKAGIAALLLLGLLAVLMIPPSHNHRASNERGAAALLKILASGEADFRGNDRDGNGVADFWTANVSGLYDFVSPGAQEPLHLIPRDLAEADPTRPGAKPCCGYWFVAMDEDEDGRDYRQAPGKVRHLSQFAFCAYPSSPQSGRRAFYINEGNTIFGQIFNGQPDRRWPTDIELHNRWIIID